MEPTSVQTPDIQINIGESLGAEPGYSFQCFVVYIPNKDKDDQEIGTQRRWVLDLIRLLSEINRGVTSQPAEGGWLNDEGQIILEQPVIVYSYVKDHSEFVKSLPRLRAFLHRLGRETNQGEIAFEFEGRFYRIRTFDPA